MPEKFFDIFPPKTAPVSKPKKETHQVLPESFPKETPRRAFKREPRQREPRLIVRKTGKRGKRIIRFFALAVLIIAGIFLYFALPQAKISVWPETETLDFKEKIQVDSQKTQPDFLAKIIPGKVFEDDLETAQDFSVSGKVKKEEKARGTLRVYNAYSDASQILVPSRFVSAEGKLFWSVGRVTIPGGTYDSKGKLTPGYLDIEVVAAEPGPSYNIGPSTFSMPAFVGTPRYTAFYGKSTTAMSGGFSGEASRVTQADLDNARETLIKKLIEEEKNSLKSKVSPDIILLDESLAEENLIFTPSVKAGAEVQSFNAKVKVHFKALTFNKSDMDNFTKEFIKSQIIERNRREIFSAESLWAERKAEESSLKTEYSLYSMDWQSKKMVLDVNLSVRIYPSLNSQNLKKAVAGKPSKEIQILLANQPYVGKTEIKLWPFWVKKAPLSEKKIEAVLRLDS